MLDRILSIISIAVTIIGIIYTIKSMMNNEPAIKITGDNCINTIDNHSKKTFNINFYHTQVAQPTPCKTSKQDNELDGLTFLGLILLGFVFTAVIFATLRIFLFTIMVSLIALYLTRTICCWIRKVPCTIAPKYIICTMIISIISAVFFWITPLAPSNYHEFLSQISLFNPEHSNTGKINDYFLNVICAAQQLIAVIMIIIQFLVNIFEMKLMGCKCYKCIFSPVFQIVWAIMAGIFMSNVIGYLTISF